MLRGQARTCRFTFIGDTRLYTFVGAVEDEPAAGKIPAGLGTGLQLCPVIVLLLGGPEALTCQVVLSVPRQFIIMFKRSEFFVVHYFRLF